MKKIKYVRSTVKKANSRKIVQIDSQFIKFSDGSQITFDHEQDCCEYNYADFEQLDDIARGYTFEGEMQFKTSGDYGFLFGDSRRMFFVPCYSDQNGYYTSALDIYWNGVPVLSVDCEVDDGY